MKSVNKAGCVVDLCLLLSTRFKSTSTSLIVVCESSISIFVFCFVSFLTSVGQSGKNTQWGLSKVSTPNLTVPTGICPSSVSLSSVTHKFKHGYC